VGPEQNFTYMAALRPHIAFIIDIRRQAVMQHLMIRRQAVMQHLMFKAVFELSADRSQFIGRLFSMPLLAQPAANATLSEIWDAYGNGSVVSLEDTTLFARNLGELLEHLTVVRGIPLSTSDRTSLAHVYRSFFALGPAISYRGFQVGAAVVAVSEANFGALSLVTDIAGAERSFLASEDDFRYIKGMHERNLIIPLVGDFGGAGAIRSVGAWLRRYDVKVSAYYVSNVEEYLFRGGESWRSFYANVATLPLDSNSVFIRPATGNPNRVAVSSARFLRTYQVENSRAIDQWFGGRSGSPPVPTVPPTPPVVLAPPTPPGSAAQRPGTGTVSGRVTDTAGVALRSAVVTVVGTANSATSDSAGAFIILNVPPGTHAVEARRIGFAPASQKDLRVSPSDTAVINLALIPQTIFVTSVVRSPAGTTVTPARPLGTSAAGVTPVCPMLPFLAAHDAGRVRTFADARRCPQGG
jgi:hypothetical protein